MSETNQTAEKARKTAKETAAQAADAWRVPSYEVPEALRAMTEQGIEQARDTYARMKAVAEEATDMVEETVETTREGMTALQLRSLDAAKANADAYFDLTRKLLSTRSVADAIQLQTAFARDRFEAFVDYTKEVQSEVSKLSEEAVRPARDAFTKVLNESKAA
ncbi:MAG TPA: phasin [Afifellaceae bacterium]|nr:phasin [Afifellaceae bacterium]